MQQASPGSSSGSLGFIGAGAITAAIVAGLHVVDPPAVFLSPRGRRVGRELASRFPSVRVCRSNQEVLEYATSIVVAVRPQQTRAVFEELSFRPQHVIMSVVAGVPLARLHDWAAPAGRLVRAIPLPSAARARSLTAMYPDDTVARELFGRLGGILVPSEEATLDALSAATATFAAHLDYLTTIADWLADQGLDPAAATAYTSHIFGQLGQSLLERAGSLATLTDLRRDGVPELVRRALDRVLARLRQQPTPDG